MSETVLSILIPTLVERRRQFEILHRRLKYLSQNYAVEILVNEDNRQKTTGQKRNELIDLAKGKYSAFIDDDDDVPDYYFDSIFNAIRKSPVTDCIGFRGLLKDRSKPHSMRNPDVFEHKKGHPYSDGKVNGKYLRPPNHLNPMLTEYFRKIRFPDLTFAEDYDFCLKLDKAGLIKNDVFLDVVMYYYYYNPKKK